MSNTKKILVPIFNRAHYGRLRSVLKAIKEYPKLELQLMVASGVASNYFWLNIKHSQPHSWRKAIPVYLRARLMTVFKPNISLREDFLARLLMDDGFQIDSRVPLFFDGGIAETAAKSVGIGLIGIVDEFKRLKPDIIFINADRFEMMAVALAAAYLNIPIAHNEAGDVSGTLDESVRHAITKLAHLHFTSTELSKKRVIQMGENPEFVFSVGSPAIDVISKLDTKIANNPLPNFDIQKPYLLILLHPVATENAEYNRGMIRNLIAVLKELNVPTIFLGSNIDAMSAEIGAAVRSWKQESGLDTIAFTKHLPPDDFYKILANATVAIGNSSSFIREGAYFGTPVVLIGSRQFNRERGDNIMEVSIDPEEIKKAIARQLKHGPYQSDTRFGIGHTSQKIAEVLATVQPPTQKRFWD